MKIGLSKTIIDHNGFMYDAIDHGWYETLRGHNLFLLPNTLNQDFNVIANDLDSLILTGGEYQGDRKAVELDLLHRMIARDKPVLGISEGAFLIAELLGGTEDVTNNYIGLDHPIFYHREVLEVNCYHNRCIKTLPENTDILCVDYLGNTQAFINGKLAGVVWNPEKMKKPWIPPEIAFILRI